MSHVKPLLSQPKPSDEQRQWLSLGLDAPGGKLPNFDEAGERIEDVIIDFCLEAGWAERWMYNPLKPNWKVCRLTEAGRKALVKEVLVKVDFTSWQRDPGAETVLKAAAK